MILEGIVTSLNSEGEVNIAPMGPIVNEDFSLLILRPFQTSQTYQNLKATGCGVFHVTDDVLMIAQAAIGKLETPGALLPAQKINGKVLAQACRWYEFETDSLDDSQERVSLVAKVVHTGRIRDFIGFNRAKHAVLEAAILATRVQILPAEEISKQLKALASPVEKTAGPAERLAFELLLKSIAEFLPELALPSFPQA